MSREQPKRIVAAIYARKSSVDGLEQEFNSIHAQREYGEAFIKSQGALGWLCSPDRYDDGGFSGGTMNRPAFKRLMADAESGRINAIVVYKLERLSRSLSDALNIMKRLDELGVTLVSVTQQFNTATSAGRMCVNMMLTLAQYERENASERTRDKIAASRRKGKWAGGRPPLGYDIDRDSKRLVINPEEANRVREIFRLYIEHERLMAVIQEVARLGWANKRWTNSKGVEMGGRVFDKASLRMLLLNDIYIGRVRHKEMTYPGQHEAIVDEKAFRKVGELLKRNGQNGGALVRNKHGALLRGLLNCACCNCGMRYAYSSKASGKRYAYYLCASASTRGWDACPAPSVSAGQIEAFVVDRIRGIGNDPKLIAEIVLQSRPESERLIKALADEQATLQRERKRLDADLRKAVASAGTDKTSRIADLNERLAAADARLAAVPREIESLRCTLVTKQEVAAAFARFDELWAALEPHERVQVIHLLVKRIEWDGREGNIRIVFQPTGLRGLVDRTASHAPNIQKVAAA